MDGTNHFIVRSAAKPVDYKYAPKTKGELEKIINKKIEEEGVCCNLNDIDVSKITDMSYLFSATMFWIFNGDINRWDVSNVTNMEGMFWNSNFNGDISDWDVSNVENMYCMFNTSKFRGDLSPWTPTSLKCATDIFTSCKATKPKWFTDLVECGEFVAPLETPGMGDVTNASGEFSDGALIRRKTKNYYKRKMKSIKEYVSESVVVADADEMLFENMLEEGQDLQTVYEELFSKMFVVNEGLFSKIGEKLAKLGQKAQTKGEEIDSKIDNAKAAVEDKVKNLSDSAKAAIENAKKEAGDAWDTVKDAYIETVSKVDNAVKNAKASIEGTAKEIGAKVSELEGTVAKVMLNAYANGKDKLMNAFSNVKQASAISSLIVAAARCRKYGVNDDSMLNILISAGVKTV